MDHRAAPGDSAGRHRRRSGLRRPLFIAVTVLGLAGAGATVAVTYPAAASATAEPAYSVLTHQLLTRLNAVRAADGRPAVTLDVELTEAATSHSRLLARHGHYAIRFAGEATLVNRVRSYGYVPRVVRQTLASAKTPHSLRKRPAQLATGSSPLLAASVTDAGIGISRANNGRYWVTLLVAQPGLGAGAAVASGIAENVLGMLNAERSAHGLPALTMNAKLIASARGHNLDMARQNAMSHQLPHEAYFATRIERAGYHYSWAGENIGWNSDMSLAGVRQLETMMYHETPPNDGHRRNILSKHYANVGIDVYFDHVNDKVWLTQDFGRPS